MVEPTTTTVTTEAERPIRRRKWEKGKYIPKRKVCVFCADNKKVISYRDSKQLREFISDRGKIDPRRRTGTCARHQRALTIAIKRARHLALLPYVPAHVYATGGVGLKD